MDHLINLMDLNTGTLKDHKQQNQGVVLTITNLINITVHIVILDMDHIMGHIGTLTKVLLRNTKTTNSVTHTTTDQSKHHPHITQTRKQGTIKGRQVGNSIKHQIINLQTI